MQRAQSSTSRACPQPTERFGLRAMPNKNPARGSGRARLLSFNFLNALICTAASSVRMPYGIYPRVPWRPELAVTHRRDPDCCDRRHIEVDCCALLERSSGVLRPTRE